MGILAHPDRHEHEAEVRRQHEAQLTAWCCHGVAMYLIVGLAVLGIVFVLKPFV